MDVTICEHCGGAKDDTGARLDLAGCLCGTPEKVWPKSFAQLQKEISDWADKTFGVPGPIALVAARANTEMAELIMELMRDENSPKAAAEVADVFIVLMRVADRLGFDIQTEIEKKMAINYARKWKLDGHGQGQHVKE